MLRFDELGESRVFREKTVAGKDTIGASLAADIDDGLLVEVTFAVGFFAFEEVGFVGSGSVRGGGIVRSVDRDGGQIESFAGSDLRHAGECSKDA